MIKAKQILKCTKIERNISLILLLSLTFLLFSYIGIVGKSIKDASFKNETETKIAKMQYEVSELESKYIEKKSKINLKFAKAEGFVDSGEKSYISVNSQSSEGVASSRN